jgi:cellulose synthase/poly-beta-1,6-N-acetylglucosamine synthase-like glycosyltransferase
MDTVERKIMQLWTKNETERLSKDYSIDLVFTERPICVISIAKNNAKDYQYEYNLQSILNQNYSNYKIIVIDRGSTDGTGELIKKFMREHNKLPSRYIFIEAK